MKPTLCLILWIGMVHAMAESSDGRPERPQQFISPDGRFGVQIVNTGEIDGVAMKEMDLVAMKSGAKLCELATLAHQRIGDVRLLWSPDSQRLVVVSPTQRGDWTELWVRKTESFELIDLPEFPSLDYESNHNSKTILASYSAVRWTKPDVLLMNLEAEDDDGNSGRLLVALHFDADNHVTVSRLHEKDH